MMKETDIVKVLDIENDEFKRLGEEHRKLDLELDEYNKRPYLTPEEELEKKRLQKLKLQKKDKMAEIIRNYKRTMSLN
jgi:hypothetical protein